MRLPFVIHITREKCQVCLYDGPGFSLLCAHPPPDCLKSLGESRKVCTPLQGDNGFSILTGGTFIFKTVFPPPQTVRKVSARAEKSVPHYRATTDSQSSLRVLLLLRQSPPPQVSARVFSGCISGVCLQGCIQGTSQVFAIDGNGHRPCKRLGHSQPFLT